MHREREITVEYQMATFKESGLFKNPFNLNFAGYFHTAGNVYIAAQLPVAKEWIDGITGNPYLGVEIVDKKKSSRIIQLGVRFPFAKDDFEISNVAYTGSMISTDQSEAFMPLTWTLQPVIGYQWILPKSPTTNHVFKLTGSPTALLPAGRDNLLLFDMTAEAWLQSMGKWEAGAGLQGRVPIGDDSQFSESFIGFACLSLRFNLGKHLRPGFRFVLPLSKDFSDNIDYTLNVDATVDLIKWLDEEK